MSSSPITHVRRRVLPTLARIALVALAALLVSAGTATVALAAPAAGPPSITSQPTNTSPTEGRSYGFSVAFISVPSSRVDWQMSTDGGTTWTPARGENYSESEDPDTGEQESYIGFGSADITSSGTLYRAVLTNSEGTTTSASARLTVTPTNATITAESGNGQTVPAGRPFPTPSVARVLNGSGAPVPGAVVTFTVSAGSASFPGTTTSAQATTDAQGRATAPTLTAGSTPGQVTVTATTAGASTPASFTETVTASTPNGPVRADVAATLTVPSAVRAGSTFTVRLVVRNTGPNPAAAIASGVALPPGLTVLSAGGGSTGPDRRSVGFSDPTLAPGASVTHTVQLGVERGTRGARTIGGGVVSTRTVDPDYANNYQLRTSTIR